MHLLCLRYVVRFIDGQHNNVCFDDKPTLNVKTHISVKINIFEHLNCAYRTSDNTPSYRPIYMY